MDAAKRPLTKAELACAGIVDWGVSRIGLARPIVFVSGFFRSGTTWFQECIAEGVCGKTVFEPLSPYNRRVRARHESAGIAEKALAFYLVPAAMPPDDALWSYLDAVFSGRYYNNISRICRRSIAESFRSRIVVKDVRMQFNLQGLHRRFDVPVVHVRRNPIAVVASLLATDWGWTFEDLRLADLIPAEAERLREFDSDLVSRASAYWAVTERFVDESLAGRPWAKLVTYETAVASPELTFSELIAFIGCGQRATINHGLQSRTTSRGPRATLQEPAVLRIKQVVGRLYPEYVF